MRLPRMPGAGTAAALLLCAAIASCIFPCCTSLPQEPQPEGESSAEPPQSWRPPASIEELRGVWKSAKDGTWEYPVTDGSAVYVRRSLPAQDDTTLWKAYAGRHGMDMAELWEKRYAYMPLIYGQELPAADANGTQYGCRLSRTLSGQILCTKVYLIPEKTAALNLAAFRLSDDGTVLTETQEFHLFSTKFRNLPPSGGQYARRAD